METYFDSHLDLLQRQLAKTSDRLKLRAEERLNDIKKDVLKNGVLKNGVFKTTASNIQLERELQRYRLKVRTCAACEPLLPNVDRSASVGLLAASLDHPGVALRQSRPYA